MVIETKYHGEITIEENEIIKFENGIPGFINEKKYTLLPLDKESPFSILQSIETTELGFVVVNPFHYTKEYEFDLTDGEKEAIQLTNAEDLEVLAIMTVKDSLKNSTANLQAPLIINYKKKLGKQVILNNSNYSIRYPLFAEAGEK
ncbi:flagellar assembly protein FliW [Bacillus sp. UMB0899]|uniref:flagellar assembly protein FliW n=1 Tax=Metabacillus schmidteae TaxID=2730405 RepID=UPI000C81015E|nr:flagellar assembly protein FliW [Metabacillus schmidteae]PMC36630.1 flagellar assembly protein FliW [Bacillus sp. UMB0899]